MPEEIAESAPGPVADGAAASSPRAAAGKRPDAARRRPPYAARRKVCRFCAEKIRDVDYKQIQTLRTFLSEGGRILSSRVTGNCAGHQRQLGRAVKRARNLALLPYVVF